VKKLIILIIGFMFIAAPVLATDRFALTKADEDRVSVTQKLVDRSAEVRELNAKLEHKKKGERFYWFMIGAALKFSYDANKNDDAKKEDKKRRKCKRRR
jgi:hypothetical protein